jgi:hypothetical protein
MTKQQRKRGSAGVRGSLCRWLWIGCILPLLASCATTSKLTPAHVPPGSLRVAQVMYLASRAEIISSGTHYQILLASGIDDAEIQDGSAALARVYCCWEPNEKANAIAFHVPAGLGVELGDIVEVKAGQPPARGSPGTANIAVRVRQKYADTYGPCRWVPEDPRLWTRILYCDWMPEEGWVEQKAFWKTWLKPPPTGKER